MNNQETSFIEAMAEQWKADRMGKFTASAMGKLMGKPRNKDRVFTDAGESYIYAKIGETLTGEYNEVSSASIKWGEEHEEAAIKTFASLSGMEVAHFGKANPKFYPYQAAPDHAGGSPDGITNDDPFFDAVEIKCPYESRNHAEALHLIKTNKFILEDFNADYFAQIQANILFTGARGGWFVSYDPRCVEYKYCCVWTFIPRNSDFIDYMVERLDQAIAIKKATLEDIGFFEQTKAA